jgi:argininosuccinate lyase
MRKGRLDTPASELSQKFSQSVSFDRRLYRYDIRGSIAHASALQAAGILTENERTAIEEGLRQIEREIEAGQFEWKESLEDVHMNIEAALTSRLGATGGKLHTARSRNDQVALDLRLYMKAAGAQIIQRISALQEALLDRAELHSEVLLPGYTHLQRAQPISLAHYFLAHVEALARDLDRVRDCLVRTDVLPLGSGALAGSTLVLDREKVARELGFARVSQNSYDAVGDRDFVCEFLFCLAMIGLHLSRLSEDFILWSTAEFGYVQFSDAYSTGSSLMPQKKNPDVAELTRGKTGRLYGNLLALLTTLKGLPASYNRDLQEDKEALFDSVDTVDAGLEIWAAMLPEITFEAKRMAAAAADPNLLATDVAEYLVKKGLPFREAHEAVGRMVAWASAQNLPLDKVALSDMKEMSPLFEEDVRELFDPKISLSARTAVGAPAPANVRNQIGRWRKIVRGE